MNREVIISAILVMGLFLAGGVYSQMSGSSSVAIGNGIAYLEGQPSLGGELLGLYWMSQRFPDYGFGELVSSKVDTLDSFNYPLGQFLLGESISSEGVSEKASSDPYYSSLIDFFNCRPLDSVWLDSLSSVSFSDSSLNDYADAHSLLLLQMVKMDYFGGRCGDYASFSPELDDLIVSKVKIVSSQLDDKSFFDVWVERAAVLGFAGYDLSSDDVEYILSQQSDDGGWRPSDYYDGDWSSSPHTTVLATWSLLEASK
ncbi:MAG: hypothetical protein V1776_01750 [Candidatus Diapherotrites archaeon]